MNYREEKGNMRGMGRAARRKMKKGKELTTKDTIPLKNAGQAEHKGKEITHSMADTQ